MLFTKDNVGKIDYIKLSNNKRFKGKPSKVETYKDSPLVYNYYGNVTLDGLSLQIACIRKNDTVFERIELFSDNKPDNVNALKNSMIAAYGNSFVRKQSKLRTDPEYYITFDTYQWTIGQSRIQFDVMSKTTPETKEPLIFYGSVSYSDLDKLKKINPITYITCSSDMISLNGNITKLDDIILGIDEDNNKVLTDDNFDSVYKLNGNFLKLEKNESYKTRIIIDRTSGRVSGSIENDKSRYSIHGTCTRQSNARLF
ncbi:hypothetical protein [Citrifermentans bremense]|uniref:hypothetical protein n=1 Tax=Citrifermentans bremense TaxID=60035 RepID=UPI00047CA718|nr:hypothetical protein [Citrifermentans bremense]